MILTGDIGGTKTNLSVFEERGKVLREVFGQQYPSRGHKTFEELLRAFLSSANFPRGSISRACFGVAGPVKNGRCEATNLPWVLDSTKLEALLDLPMVKLINDLEAIAWGVAALTTSDVSVLNWGHPLPTSNAAVIAAGTGLGEAGLCWMGVGHRPFASEGGHSDFAPRNEIEIELLRHLSAKFGRVSYERILSGPGLFNVYTFFRDQNPSAEPKWLAEELVYGDPAAVISKNALEGKVGLCEQALDLFVTIYGAEAGNLALKVMATSGIYLGGGIAPKILPRLQGQLFLDAFVSKGRMRSVLEAIPVSVILNDRLGLSGAALAVMG